MIYSGIVLFVGKQGKGKTYSAIHYIESILNDEQIILTNVKSYYNNTKDKHKILYYQTFSEIIIKATTLNEIGKKYIIFFDEIFTTLEKSGSLQRKYLSFISQLRKRNILLISTAQEWAEINITFRRYCRFEIDCNMINIPITKKAICINKVNDGDQIHWDNDLQDFIAPTLEINIHKAYKKIVELYDTFETIEMTEQMNKSKTKF